MTSRGAPPQEPAKYDGDHKTPLRYRPVISGLNSRNFRLETLKVKNMLKNRKLAKHIADASWGELVRKLEYKAQWTGKHLVKIDQWFASSKTCHVCNNKLEHMNLSVRLWVCDSCETEHDRDINAAINIRQQGILKLKAEGLSVSACGGSRKSGSLPVAA